MQSTSFDMLGCLTHKLESRLLGQTSTTWYADDTTLMAEREEELNSLLMKVKEESEKTGLKLNIQKTKIVASSPITSWQIDAETMWKQWLHFLGLQITVDNNCSHKIKWHLPLGGKAMTHLDIILKSRDITANRGLTSKSYCFSSSHVQMWGLDHKEGWVKKNWHFWTVVLEKTWESFGLQGNQTSQS